MRACKQDHQGCCQHAERRGPPDAELGFGSQPCQTLHFVTRHLDQLAQLLQQHLELSLYLMPGARNTNIQTIRWWTKENKGVLCSSENKEQDGPGRVKLLHTTNLRAGLV